MDNEIKSKIPKTTVEMMVAVAVILDLIQFLVNFIPTVGQIISTIVSVISYTIFGIWFLMYGVNIITKSSVVFSILELIPIINALPTFTALVIKRVADLKSEEALRKIPLAKTAIKIGQKEKTLNKTSVIPENTKEQIFNR